LNFLEVGLGEVLREKRRDPGEDKRQAGDERPPVTGEEEGAGHGGPP